MDDRQLREISQLLIFVTENSANLINQPLLRLGLLWEGFRETRKEEVEAIARFCFWAKQVGPADSPHPPL